METTEVSNNHGDDTVDGATTAPVKNGETDAGDGPEFCAPWTGTIVTKTAKDQPQGSLTAEQFDRGGLQ